MRVTPLDIRKQEFKKVMRGLDADEVFAFLKTVAEEYEAVLSDNKNLRERLVALEDRLHEFQAIETNLRNTLLTAEKVTHEAKENARREASLMIREAEMEADKAAESIRAHTSQLRREILELKKNKDNYITRLKTLLDSHKKMLDGFEEDFAGVDQAIEKIGQQVEEDVSKNAAPPRMSREKITEGFGHEPKDKVTWGEERRREDEPRPQMPRPGYETRETPNQKAEPPEDIMNLFAPPSAGQGTNRQDASMKPPQHPAPKPVDRLHVEPIGATVADTMAAPQPPQARPAPPQPPQPEAQDVQDEWRQYDVRKKPTDWRNYDLQAQQPQQPPPQQQPPQQPQRPVQPPSSPRPEDMDVESALSSLKEAANAAEKAMPRREMNQTPAQGPAQPQAPPSRPANPAVNPETPWSMEDLRRNLTNLSKDEGNKG